MSVQTSDEVTGPDSIDRDEENVGTHPSSPDTLKDPVPLDSLLLPSNKGKVTVELSQVSAFGGEDSENEDPDESSQRDSGNLMDTLTNSEGIKNERRKGRVVFRENITETFDDTDLWISGIEETAQDMITAYQRECMNMKVKPIQLLLDQLKGVYDLSTPIDTIDLTGVKLDNRTCEVLEAVLSRISSITLKLERTNLEDEGVIAIFEMVEFYGCAYRLLLAHNNKLRPRAWLTIGRTLKKSPFITTIDVSYCALDEQTLTLLLRAVRANCGLKVLKMEGNNLTGKGTFILMAAMKFNENLEELYLSRNHLAPENGQHLGNILRSNHTLRVLDVSDNNLQDAGVRYICAGIAEQQEGLHVLNVGTNNLTHEGVHHVSAMLPCTKTLRELNISNNKFGDNGLFMLKLGILANRSVEKVMLSGTKITCEGAIALAEVLAESRYLTHVDLKENEIRVAGLMALTLALRMNFHLLHLETPKTFKVEQHVYSNRDRQLIRDLLNEMEKFRSRNHKEKEERDKEKAKRLHEETHANQSVEMKVEKPDKRDDIVEEEEEKEVDPLLVGSLDNVYTDEEEAEMMKEDPFKKAPVMDKDHSSTFEMEETVNALLVYSSESSEDNPSPIPEEEEGDQCNTSSSTDQSNITAPSPPTTNDPMDLLSSPMNAGESPLVPDPSQELLPDLIGLAPGIQQAGNNHTLPPDVTPSQGAVPPDLAAVDLLNSDDIGGAGNPLDLTADTSGVSPDVTQQ